jgi:hypothetical protein
MSNYLNSAFLNTTAIVKAPDNILKVSFLEYVETKTHDESILKLAQRRVTAENRDKQIDSVLSNKEYIPTKLEDTPEYKDYLESEVGYPTLSVIPKNKEVNLETISLPKMPNILRDHLSDIYYNKILELSNLNDKSVRIKAPTHYKDDFYGKIKKYIYSGIDFLCIGNDDLEISRRIITRFVHMSNSLAVNCRVGPGAFGIVHPNMVKYLNAYDGFGASVEVSNDEKYSLVGNIADIDIFINSEQDENLIVVGKSGTLQNGGILIAEKEIEINDTINWTGKIFDMGSNAKYMYENVRVGILNDLPWHKRMLLKLFSKKF